MQTYSVVGKSYTSVAQSVKRFKLCQFDLPKGTVLVNEHLLENLTQIMTRLDDRLENLRKSRIAAMRAQQDMGYEVIINRDQWEDLLQAIREVLE